MTASVAQDGKRLILSGALLRGEVASLYGALNKLNANEINLIDLVGVDEIDSAGLAMLSKWINANYTSPHRPMLVGEPEGLAGLRSAYRLTEQLEFVRSN